jgi:hypothetical protein
MIWGLRHYGPPGVFVSGKLNGLYAECWPAEALRPLWGHREMFRGHDLYPYYTYVGAYGTVLKVNRDGISIAFGTLEECMTAAEKVMTDGIRPTRPQDADRKFTP